MTTIPLSFTGKRWRVRHQDPVPNILETLSKERGITFDGEGKLSDPFLFPEMNMAVSRIRKAMQRGETIGIFGDYDADGITAAAQLVRYFRRHGIEPVIHLPHRALEGYGMKNASIDALHAKGVTLIITVDTGIAAHDQLAHASTLGIDVIVTDHHRPKGGRPQAFAVIHPQVPAPFPNAHLCGAGVAFMLLRALEKEKTWDEIDIDIVLATIGTIGDLVPLIGENRTLVMHGLKFLKSLPASPLKDFVQSVRSEGSGPMTATDVAFRLVPRINAAGRMAHPDIALRALLEGGEAQSALNELNAERKSFVLELDERLSGQIGTDPFVVVTSERVTPGTAGLLASRYTERTGRPTLVGAVVGDMVMASVRSPIGVDAVECLSHPSVAPMLLSYGGHAQAAGCTFAASYAPKLSAALREALVSQGVQSEQLCPTIDIDMHLMPEQVTMESLKSLQSLEPFGTGNNEPVFLLRAQVPSDIRAAGSDGTHLQCCLGKHRAIGFNLGHLASSLGAERVDVACRFGVNTWNGRESLQLFIQDLRLAKPDQS